MEKHLQKIFHCGFDEAIALEIIAGLKDQYTPATADYIRYIKTNNSGFSYYSIQDYLKSLDDHTFKKGVVIKKFTANTFNKYVSALKHRIRYLMDISSPLIPERERRQVEILLSRLPLKKRASSAVSENKILTNEEVYRLIDRAPEKLGLIIEFLYNTGLRISEALDIELSAMKETPEYYVIRVMGKGSKERNVMVSKELINRIIKHFAGCKYLFETTNNTTYDRSYISRWINKESEAVLGKTMSSHNFRHSFASHYIKETGDIKGASCYLGHSSVATTLDLYVHTSASFEDIAKVMARKRCK